ncbi:MAG: aerotolerance regulator BatA [Gemmatimonadetes bacterium]|jgi:Ca-activated chloride channel family protein|nr:aerotolerance regulator BatA [Gemmatimonadota bacterium]
MALWALLPILAAGLFVLRRNLRLRAAVRYSFTAPLAVAGPSLRVRARRALPVLRILALVLLAVAVARPQIVEREEEILTEGIDIMLALDVSGSMQAEDFKPKNRLRVAKNVVGEFLDMISNDRVGLVVFAGQAYTQCPLTLDYGVLRNLLEGVSIGSIEDGTAIGTALANSVSRLRDSAAHSKVVILLTDGENNAGKIDPSTAAKVAEAFGVRVYTIGVGKEGGAPIPIVHPVYGKILARNADGSIAMTKLDEETLRGIASVTGGEYFRATDPDALAGIYARILDLERTKFQVKRFERAHERFRWAALPALLLLLLEMLLAHTRLRVLP